jgi:hypothetical protein
MSNISLKPKQRLQHPCGLDFTNTTTSPVGMPNDRCPQCGNPVLPAEISGGQAEMTRWILHPLHGMRFANELGSEVSIQFEKGREEELFMSLQRQLNDHYQAHLRAEGNSGVISEPPRASSPIPIPPRYVVNEQGDLTLEHQTRTTSEGTN